MALAALVPVMCWVCFFVASSGGWRERFLSAAVLWGLAVLVLTEGLNLGRWLDGRVLLAAWALILVTSAIFAWRGRRPLDLALRCLPAQAAVLAAAALLLCLTAGIAFFAPPNNWDSMTTHMARVAHWVQDKTVAFYPTSMVRQLNYPPWAEYAIMQFQMLTDSDRWANFIQWFSGVGSLLGVSLIAARLNAGKWGQLLAAVIALTIPVGILESTSTQTDYVASFWLVCFVNYVLEILRAWSWSSCLLAGIALGLAWLIKGTCYIYALPFILWLAVAGFKKKGKAFAARLLVVLVLAFVLNGPYYLRNMAMTSTLMPPAEKNHLIGKDLSAQVFASNLVLNLGLHATTPWPTWNEAVDAAVYRLHQWLGIKVGDERVSMSKGVEFHLAGLPLHEDNSGNMVHVLMTLACLVLYVFMVRKVVFPGHLKYYLWAVLGGAVLFLCCIKWSPFQTRYHLPIFVLLSPFLAIVLEKSLKPGWLAAAAWTLMALSLPWFLCNRSRPLLGPHSVLTMPRQEQYFANNPGYIFSYVSAVKETQATGCTQAGLVLGGDTWEYPLWVIARGFYGHGFRFEHVQVGNISSALPYPLGQFDPCALIDANTLAPLALGVGGKLYVQTHRYAFFSVYSRFDFLPVALQDQIRSHLK